MRFIVFNSIILLFLDFYIYRALRTTNIKWAKTRTFTILWWSYSALLFIGIIGTVYFGLRLAVRSFVLVAFFITFVTKLVFAMTFIIDDVRRGGVWVKRKIFHGTPAVTKTLPELKETRISRSDFLSKTRILTAAAPFTSLSCGIISGAYDYRVRHQKLYLPNLHNALHGMKIGQLSDIHSGSFYNKKAVQGGVDMLLA